MTANGKKRPARFLEWDELGKDRKDDFIAHAWALLDRGYIDPASLTEDPDNEPDIHEILAKRIYEKAPDKDGTY